MTARKVIKMLVCPKCIQSLKQNGKFSICYRCCIAYPIIDDVPDMLLEDSWSLEKARKNKFIHRLSL